MPVFETAADLMRQASVGPVSVVDFAKAAGLDPDPWQIDFLRSDARQIIANTSRQVGKSTCTALKVMHRAVYWPGSLILMLSPSQRQSGELLRKCRDAYGASDRPVDSETESALTLELTNGSRIVSLPGKESTIRGYSSVNMLVVDEAAYVPDDLYNAVLPMLAVSQGQIILLSTPWGKRGFFYEEFVDGEGWEKYEVPWYKCPRLPRELIEQQKRRRGESWFLSQYECVFLDTETSLFRREDIDAIIHEGVEEWDL